MKLRTHKKIILIAAALFSLCIQLPAPAMQTPDDDIRIQNIISEFPTLTRKAEIIAEKEILESKVALIFEGNASETTISKMIPLLKEYNVPAVFFLSGISVVETPEIIKNIVLSGFEVGNYSLNGEKEMEKLPVDQVIRNIFSAQRIIRNSVGISPVMIRFNGSEYTDNLLIAAKASGLEYAIMPSAYLNYRSFSTQEELEGYVQRTRWGSIISIKLGQALDEAEYMDVLKDLDERPAIDPEPSVEIHDEEIEEEVILKDEETYLIQMLESLLKSYSEAGFEFVSPLQLNTLYDPEFAMNFEEWRVPNPTLPEVFSSAHTTQRAVALTFNHLAETDQELLSLLDTLDELEIQATFFVTGLELVQRKAIIREIAERGHLVENAGFSGRLTEEMSYNDIYKEILKGKKYLEQELGVESRFFRSLSTIGIASDLVSEAAANIGVVSTGYDKNPRIEPESTTEEVMTYFANGFNRGNILFFTTDGYPALNDLIGKIAAQVRDTGYDFTTISALYDGQYKKIPLEEIRGWDTVKMNLDFDPEGQVSGHFYETIGTQDKTVFLTFDDWGSDKTITKILDNLRERNVKATFFVIGRGVALNPNLLRAIDAEGHDIACHSYEHEANFVNLGAEHIQNDVVKCYQTITEIIGREPELYFRLPRQESNISAVNAILAAGFTDIIQSSISTGDYHLSKDEVSKFVSDRVHRGAIIIMHLTDHSSGADSLPQVIEHLRARGYKIAKLSDYLERE